MYLVNGSSRIALFLRDGIQALGREAMFQSRYCWNSEKAANLLAYRDPLILGNTGAGQIYCTVLL